MDSVFKQLSGPQNNLVLIWTWIKCAFAPNALIVVHIWDIGLVTTLNETQEKGMVFSNTFDCNHCLLSFYTRRGSYRARWLCASQQPPFVLHPVGMTIWCSHQIVRGCWPTRCLLYMSRTRRSDLLGLSWGIIIAVWACVMNALCMRILVVWCKSPDRIRSVCTYISYVDSSPFHFRMITWK